MGAYIGAAAALGLELEMVDPRERKRAPPARAQGAVAGRIRLADYPQLKKARLATARRGQLTPEEALELYERNWRHVDRPRSIAHERALIEGTVAAFGGGRLLV